MRYYTKYTIYYPHKFRSIQCKLTFVLGLEVKCMIMHKYGIIRTAKECADIAKLMRVKKLLHEVIFILMLFLQMKTKHFLF
jgi:hypothetical protein